MFVAGGSSRSPGESLGADARRRGGLWLQSPWLPFFPGRPRGRTRDETVRASQDPAALRRALCLEHRGGVLGATWKPGCCRPTGRSCGGLGFFIGVPAEISTVQLSRLLLLVSPGASNFWSLPRQRQPQALSVVCSGRRAPPPVGARLTAPGECPGRLPGLAFHSQERPVSPLATPGSRRETEPRLLSLMH